MTDPNQEAEVWEPIETAPHDGRWHFIAHPTYGVPIVARRTGPGSEEFEWFFGGFRTGWAANPLGSPNEDARMSANDTPNQTADADTLANQCPKCCGAGSIIYIGAPSIVCIDCRGSWRLHTRSVTNGER